MNIYKVVMLVEEYAEDFTVDSFGGDVCIDYFKDNNHNVRIDFNKDTKKGKVFLLDEQGFTVMNSIDFTTIVELSGILKTIDKMI